MLGSSSRTSPLGGLLTRLREWPTVAQQQARRNAMIAATACTQRRAEREDVADFLAKRYAPSAPSITASPADEFHKPRTAHAR